MRINNFRKVSYRILVWVVIVGAGAVAALVSVGGASDHGQPEIRTAVSHALSSQFDSRKNQTRINLNVKEQSFTNWDSLEGISYKQVPGANLGPTSFEVMDDNRIAFLCNSTSEIIIVDKASGKAIKKFNVSFAPRDFSYSGGYFFVLTEYEVIQYDENGKGVNTFSIPNSYVGVERLARFNNATYLLLPSGNSLMIESNGHSIESREREGWITGTGHFVETRLNGNNSYSIKIATGDDKSYEKVFTTDKKVAGVFAVGSTNSRVVLDVQTFISENPISVERTLIVVELNSDGLGPIIVNTKVPDCYYVLSNKDFSLIEDGTIFNMVTAPQGVFVFSLAETMSGTVQGYPHPIVQTKYHFNDHLVQVDKNEDVGKRVSIPDSPQVTRTQIINNAMPYTSFTWTAYSNNSVAGGNYCSSLGRYVYAATPANSTQRGWVVVGTNTSMPYAWGGWSTQSQHIGQMTTTTNTQAGDICHAGSIGGNCTGLSSAPLSCASGHDCSGLVSRAWELPYKRNTGHDPTYGLVAISTEINYSQLQPGDIVNKEGDHTRLIKTYFPLNGSAEVIEASGRDWRTSTHTYTPIQEADYTARVYNNISGGGTLPGSFTLTLTPECDGTTSQIRLNWTASSLAATYDIYRNGSLYASGITGLQYINSGNITVGTSYSYYVQARNTAGSTNSNTQSATAPNCTLTPNDQCSGAIALSAGVTATVNTANATSTGDPTPTCQTNFGNAVWYTFTPASNGTVTFSTCGSNFDTVVQVYTGSCGALSAFACNDDNGPDCAGLQASVSFAGTAGTTYRILAGGFNSESGNLQIVARVAASAPPAPTANTATNITSSSFTANWSSSSGATGYRLDVSISSSFGSYVSGYQNLDVGNVLSRSVTGLSASTTYYYRVRAYNGAGTSGDSNIINLTTAGNPPPAPTATSATNVTSSSFTANWNSSSGATGYRLDVSTSSSFGSYVSGYQNLDVGNVLSRSVTGLSTATTYYYRVRAYNGAGTSGDSNIINLTTAGNPPPAPTATSATNVTSSSFTANWNSSSGATGYRLDVSTSSSFGSYVSGYQNLDVGNVLNRSVTGLSAATTYYYRVRAYNGAGTSGDSNIISLTTCNAPGAFSLTFPSNGQSFSSTTTSVPLSWGPSANADSYDVYFGTSSNPPFLANQPGTGRTVPVTAGQMYWWKVVAKVNCDSATSTAGAWSFSVQQMGRTNFDFDGDGKTDIAVYRAGATPTAPSYWHVLQSSDNTYVGVQFGAGEDKIVPADFDGDGKTNFAVWRPSTGIWYTSLSAAINYGALQWGISGDVPVPGDYDGDGKTDHAVFRPSNGYWYVRRSSNSGFLFQQFGSNGDRPLVGDFDGDGKTDFAYVRVVGSDLSWNILQSSNGAIVSQNFGLATDRAVAFDFDGDRRANIAVFRPSTGRWYTSTNPATNYGEQQWGQNGDIPVPGDYDGDGKADLAVFRPSTTNWYILKSSNTLIYSVQWGLSTDLTVPTAFVP